MEDVRKWDRKVASLLATLEDAARALELSVKQDKPQARTRMFRLFVHSMDKAIEKYEHLPDE